MIKILEVNATTGEVVERDMNAEEIAQYKADQANAEAERLATEQAESEKQAKLESAKAKLAALGLDEAEVNAILGL